ncbi:MAG: outer membrane protein assembly factor BamD [Desulfobacteraceae bacterium]|jgi:outer membrane protein assembly factor BamD|nr:MAG: outer membrane protein assembly factor BamD [Desulfobacteraceae bacterium]
MKAYIGPAKAFLMLLFLLVMLSGCGLWNRLFPPEEDKAPAQLMSEGMEALDRGFNEAAVESFQKIKDRYPYSQFAVEAEIRLADALYARGKYDEAFDAYSEFERLRPKNPSIPYVIYRRGMCHFQQISTIDRDQAPAAKARDEFERLVRMFPGTAEAGLAQKKIRECYIQLARHELYVGNFYFKAKNYGAALGRYQYLIENYPDMGQYHEAIRKISICKELLEKQAQSASAKRPWWKFF